MSSVRGKKVLVTGGAGFIGSHLVDRLIRDEPADITVIDNFFLGQEANLADARHALPDLEVIRLDAADLAAMQDVVSARGSEVVFDLAVIPLPTSLTYPAWTVNTNVGIAVTFCELARRGLIASLLHCSSSEAYGTARYVPMDENHPHDAITPYAASKSSADHIIQSYVKTFGIDATVVRPFNNFGPRQNATSYAGIIPIIAHRVQAGIPIEIHGDGEQTRDFIFVRDTADMIVNVLDHCPGRVINVASGRETTINELVTRMLHIMGRPNHPVIHTAERAGDVRRHCADISQLVELLDYQPIPMRDEDLFETVEWYLSKR